MDDFSFFEATRKAPPSQPQQQAPQQQRPQIAIPRLADVQAAQQPNPSALNNLFQPKGLFARQDEQRHGSASGTNQQEGPLPHTANQGPMPQPTGPSTVWRAPNPQQGVPSSHHPQPQPVLTQPMQQAAYAMPQPQQAAAPPSGVMPGGTNAIVVSRRQQGNPLLKHIKNVRWVFGDIGPDYLLGVNACALFLSLRYHLLHPQYILYRIKELQRAYVLRVLLVHVDVEDVVHPLGEITKAAALNDCTLICAWSAEEAARYLETFKAYEHKPAASIQERVDADYASRLSSALTAVRAVNRTDSLALGAQLGTLADVMQATPEQLSACPGIGPTKVKNLWDAFNKPFKKVLGGTGVAGVPGGAPGAGAGMGARPVAGTSGVVGNSVRSEAVVTEAGGSGGSAGMKLGAGAAGSLLPETSGLPAAVAWEPGRAAGFADARIGGAVAGHQSLGTASLQTSGTIRGGLNQQQQQQGTFGQDSRGNQSSKRMRGEDDQVLVHRHIDGHGQGLEEGDNELSEGDEDGGEEEEEVNEEEDDLVRMATQIMLQVQAGAMVVGIESEGSGAEEDNDWEAEVEEL